jgi:hypothetical protein
MGGSYKQCVECGKRALSIATRCPGCGRPFPSPEAPEGGPHLDPRRFLPPHVVTVALAIAAVLAAANLGRSSQAPEHRSALIAPNPVASSTEDAHAVEATLRLETTSAAAVPASSPSEVLVARGWTSVRKSRSRSAPLEAVLTPGDTVVADSLERGWYRVALEGEVLGYSHQSTLATPAE